MRDDTYLKKRNYCEVSITLLVLFYCMINKKTPQIELKEFNKNHFSELNTWVQLQPAKYNVTVGEKKFTARYGQILTNTELLQEFSTTQHLFLFLGVERLLEAVGGVHSLSLSLARECYTSLCIVVLVMGSIREKGQHRF